MPNSKMLLVGLAASTQLPLLLHKHQSLAQNLWWNQEVPTPGPIPVRVSVYWRHHPLEANIRREYWWVAYKWPHNGGWIFCSTQPSLGTLWVAWHWLVEASSVPLLFWEDLLTPHVLQLCVPSIQGILPQMCIFFFRNNWRTCSRRNTSSRCFMCSSKLLRILGCHRQRLAPISLSSERRCCSLLPTRSPVHKTIQTVWP
jgi:hypothetical protein